ncbi:hypothetical protein ACSAZL_13320 [Methanosarcina sp. T3]|uniref:hypothetical protein n=1 Tax=Methanosarcina sp. T3 TaxID=3439062 RepID=UPI003F84EAE4
MKNSFPARRILSLLTENVFQSNIHKEPVPSWEEVEKKRKKKKGKAGKCNKTE